MINLICDGYKNVFHVPIFGYGAKTIMRKGASSDMFPLSRDLNNPFISNSEKVINDSYTKCLQGLELSIPVNLSAILKFVKDLGKKVREQIKENNN